MMTKPVFKATKSKAHAAYVTEFPAGEHVFREGDLGLEMYIIQEGEVEILKTSSDGGERRLAKLEQGDFFGEMAILEGLPRTASARAIRPCKLVMIDGSTFDQMLRKTPEIAVRMMRKLSRRLRDTDRMLREALGAEESMAPEMPAQDEPKAPARGPERLIHDATGMDLYLSSGAETCVGRRDPVTGIQPDIDLSPIDGQRSISRRHATVLRQDGKLFVREEIGTMNGTFVNEKRIETGVPVEIRGGDEVRFGLVKTKLHLS